MLAHRFCIAPMMDWTGTSRKAKRNQHLSHVSISHVVPNEVLCCRRAFCSERIWVSSCVWERPPARAYYTKPRLDASPECPERLSQEAQCSVRARIVVVVQGRVASPQFRCTAIFSMGPMPESLNWSPGSFLRWLSTKPQKNSRLLRVFMESYSFSWYFVFGTEIHGPDRIFHGKCS